MNYQILVGHEMSIGEGKVFVNKIEKVKIDDFTTTYKINDGGMYPEFDIKLAVAIVESEIEEANKPKDLLSRIKNKFGLFYRTYTLDAKELTPTERGIFFSRYSGLRKYGFRTIGLYGQIRVGFKVLEFEFCWNEKDEYIKGKLPNALLDFRRIF